MKRRNSFLHFLTMSISWSTPSFAEESRNDLALMNSHKNSRGAPSNGETNKQKHSGNAAPSLNLTWITSNNKLPKQACTWDRAYDLNSICQKLSRWNPSSFVNPVRWQILHVSVSHKMRGDTLHACGEWSYINSSPVKLPIKSCWFHIKTIREAQKITGHMSKLI